MSRPEITQGLNRGVSEYWRTPEIEAVEENLDSDLLGRTAIWSIYQEMLVGNATAEEVYDYYYETAMKLSRLFGLNWSETLKEKGSVEDYLADAEKEIRESSPEIKLHPDWQKRLAVFDVFGLKLPLLINMALNRIEQSGESAAWRPKIATLSGEKPNVVLFEQHAKMLGLYGNRFQGKEVSGIKVVWPEKMEKGEVLSRELVLPLIQGAIEVGKLNPRVAKGLAAVEAIILIDGDWCYASNTMDIGGGSYVYLGVSYFLEKGAEALEYFLRGFPHELDHIEYLAARMASDGTQREMFSSLVMELRGQMTLLDTAAALDLGFPVDDMNDIDKYIFLLTASDTAVRREFAGTKDRTRPNELHYPNERFGGGTWEDWAAIFEVLAVGLSLGRQ